MTEELIFPMHDFLDTLKLLLSGNRQQLFVRIRLLATANQNRTTVVRLPCPRLNLSLEHQ